MALVESPEWVIEYYNNILREWKLSVYNISNITLEEAIKFIKTNKSSYLKYRIHNTKTKDIIPGAILSYGTKHSQS